MKKMLITFWLLIAFVTYLPLATPSPVFSATALQVSVTPIPKLTPMPTPVDPDVIGIEYVLPYPGILPTHPLYFLKIVRDRIIELLISDRVTKAEFYIPQADKKLGMALALRAQGKSRDATRSFADALSHRAQAMAELEARKKEGGEIPGHLIEKLTRSLTKHREVLLAASESITEVEALITRAQELMSKSK